MILAVRSRCLLQLCVDKSAITKDTKLLKSPEGNSLDADSLDIVELILTFEEAFKIDISDEAAAEMTSVQDVFNFVKKIIEELEISCPESGSRDWTEVKQFNLMFGTKLGASADSAMDLFLRPETAQGIFVNFLNVQKTGRMKLPFGIAQTGKAF